MIDWRADLSWRQTYGQSAWNYKRRINVKNQQRRLIKGLRHRPGTCLVDLNYQFSYRVLFISKFPLALFDSNWQNGDKVSRRVIQTCPFPFNLFIWNINDGYWIWQQKKNLPDSKGNAKCSSCRETRFCIHETELRFQCLRCLWQF